MPQTTAERLFEFADRQNGYFTAKQAVAAGIPSRHHDRYVKRGTWSREYRGIYRLTQYPLTKRPDLMLWYLWSRDRQDQPQGVYSHATALELFDLSDAMPAKLDMTLPKGYRKRSQIPAILRLHYEDIPDSDIWGEEGVPVTSPTRTILDLVNAGRIDENLILQGIQEGLQRGLISGTEGLREHPMVKENQKLRNNLEKLLVEYEKAVQQRRRF